MRIKNAVDAQSTKKGAAVYFRNSGTDILRAQVKADGFLYLQGGKGTGASRLDIKTVDTAADEFYTYTYDFDFDEQKIYASITDDAGNELAGEECAGFNFYKNNQVGSLDSILLSKSGFDGTMYVDYLSVSKFMSDEEIAQTVADKIIIASADDITAGFTLPKAGANGTVIEWTSENPQIEIVDGGDFYAARVTRPKQKSVSGALKCTVTKGDARVLRSFDTTVTLIITDSVKARLDLEALAPDCGYVTGDLTLPTVGSIYGNEITWRVEESEYAEISGGNTVKITRPKSDGESVNVALTAYARQNDEVCEREFSLRIIKEPQAVMKDIYSECGLVKSSTNGFTPIITSGAGYPMVEHDDVLGDDCLVFFADSTRSEAYKKMAPYAAAKVSVKAKIRVDAVESKGVNFYMQGANAFNIARINVMSGAMLLTHGASDGSTNVRMTLIPSIDTEKFYDIELAIDYTKNIFAVLVDQKTVAANMPFMVNASAPGVPVSVLFGANSESAAKLKVARLEIYADAPEISDAEACRVDAAAIDFDASQPLAADFEVAMAGANGTNIEWSSSDDSIISFENGKASVNRPDAVSGDGTVTITATVTCGKNRGER